MVHLAGPPADQGASDGIGHCLEESGGIGTEHETKCRRPILIDPDHAGGWRNRIGHRPAASFSQIEST
jgi:hypothetical protein